MLKDNNLVRHLYSCETMGNATVVCTDKTGTLTQNKMSVVKAIVFDKPFDIDSQKPTDSTFFNLLADCINVNSTAKESVVNDKKEFIGSKSEIALLEFTNKLGFPYMESRKKLQVLEMIPFLSATKKMSTIVQNNSSIPGLNSDTMTFVKGASEIILKECNHFVSNGNIVEMNSDMLNTLNANISEYAQQSLRTLSIAVSVNEKFVFLAMFGIADPIRVQVPNAVASCLRAGVGVKMVTGDNVETAKAIATQCGIYTDGIVMEGEEFRKLGNLEMEITVKKLQVLARSSPLDKQILVKCLKRMGETVAVTGDGMNDLI